MTKEKYYVVQEYDDPAPCGCASCKSLAYLDKNGFFVGKKNACLFEEEVAKGLERRFSKKFWERCYMVSESEIKETEQFRCGYSY